MIIEILHNTSWDAFFGLNVMLKADPTAEHGYAKREASGQARHQLVKVFEYTLEPMGSLTDRAICEEAFEMFNVGTGGLAQDYRGRKLRSLSVGDVVLIDGRAYSCESLGFRPRTEAELNVITDFDPVKQYGTASVYGTGSVTVPWEAAS